MIDYLAIAVGAVALILAGVALWAAVRIGRAATQTARVVEALRSRPSTSPKPPVPEVLEQPWRDSSPYDAPQWIRESFATLYDLIQDLQREATELRDELGRRDESIAARPSTGDSSGGAPAHDASPRRGRAVDLRDGAIVPSRALAAPGMLATRGTDEPALLYLNENVEIDHLALERWSAYFDFGRGEPYRRYRTVEPSRIEWNASAEQGSLLSRGSVEPV